MSSTVGHNTPLTGRVVLVTGASRGIGAAIAGAAHSAGARVVRVARSPLPALENSIDIRADLTSADDRERMLLQVSSEVGLPDAIVSNAGAFLLAPLEETTDAMLRDQLALNVEAPFALARHFLPLMRTRGSGHHLLIGSVADQRAFAGNAAYAASKFAVRGLHEVLAEEFRGTGVRCTLISPAATDTTAWDPVDPDSKPGFTPRAQMLVPSDIAAAVLFALTAPGRTTIDTIRLSAG